jgi:hypothetical protein
LETFFFEGAPVSFFGAPITDGETVALALFLTAPAFGAAFSLTTAGEPPPPSGEAMNPGLSGLAIGLNKAAPNKAPETPKKPCIYGEHELIDNDHDGCFESRRFQI